MAYSLTTPHTGQSTESSDAGIVDYLVENQRGWVFMGFPFFSANSLFPWDPANWTTLDKHASPGISEHILPSVSWRWVWKRWYVDMAGDVDDQGWVYSWRFGADTWHGSHLWFSSFVRKRVWKRLRERVSQEVSEEILESLPSHVPTHLDIFGRGVEPGLLVQSQIGPAAPTESHVVVRGEPQSGQRSSIGSQVAQSEIGSIDTLIERVGRCRIDRERIELVDQLITDASYDLLQQLASRASEVLAKFDFTDSKTHLIHHLQRSLEACDDQTRKTCIQEIIRAFNNYNSQNSYYSEDGQGAHDDRFGHVPVPHS
jgi:hypothetical protein